MINQPSLILVHDIGCGIREHDCSTAQGEQVQGRIYYAAIEARRFCR
jgi:hypothetical protein